MKQTDLNDSKNILQKHLETSSKKKVELKINDNYSTFLSIRWLPDTAKVSLHRIFLDAPRNVMDALACNIASEDRSLDPIIKGYIHTQMQGLDYRERVTQPTLSTQGAFYDLKALYDEVESTYFSEPLNLSITWFGSTKKIPKTKIVLGNYHQLLKLIKIHRLLDCKEVPKEVLAFTIYHEMLHHVCPSTMTLQGNERIHTQDFRKKEQLFHNYSFAEEWIKNNFFKECYGRS